MFCDCLEFCVIMLHDCYFIVFKVLIKLFLKLHAKFCSLESKYNNRKAGAVPYSLETLSWFALMACGQ